jgi:hypothetical protein
MPSLQVLRWEESVTAEIVHQVDEPHSLPTSAICQIPLADSRALWTPAFSPWLHVTTYRHLMLPVGIELVVCRLQHLSSHETIPRTLVQTQICHRPPVTRSAQVPRREGLSEHTGLHHIVRHLCLPRSRPPCLVSRASGTLQGSSVWS